MCLLSFANLGEGGGGAEDKGESEAVGFETEAVHMGVEREDLVEGAKVGVGAEKGVEDEGVWVGDFVEELAGVEDGRGEGGGEGEEFGGEREVMVEAVGDDDGVDAFEGGEGGAGV